MGGFKLQVLFWQRDASLGTGAAICFRKFWTNCCALHWFRFFSTFLLRYRRIWLEHSCVCFSHTLIETSGISYDTSHAPWLRYRSVLHIPCPRPTYYENRIKDSNSKVCTLTDISPKLQSSIMHILLSTVHLSAFAALFGFTRSADKRCRNIPGDPGFPSQAEWDKFNTTIDGTLVTVVPSAKFCHELPAGNCPSDLWESTVFRTTVPGAMVNVRLLAHSAFSNMVSDVPILFSVQLGTGTPLRD